jgi:hypothetical protein
MRRASGNVPGLGELAWRVTIFFGARPSTEDERKTVGDDTMSTGYLIFTSVLLGFPWSFLIVTVVGYLYGRLTNGKRTFWPFNTERKVEPNLSTIRADCSHVAPGNGSTEGAGCGGGDPGLTGSSGGSPPALDSAGPSEVSGSDHSEPPLAVPAGAELAAGRSGEGPGG